MQNFIERKLHSAVYAPVDGIVLNLSEVEDEAFKSGAIGEGIAVLPYDDLIKAPADGKLVMIFRTNHAFAIATDEGAEILVHIGIDTVKLNGYGFTRLVDEGQYVKQGQAIIKIDKEYIENMGYSLVTPVVITNLKRSVEFKVERHNKVASGKSILFEYEL